MIMNVLRRYYFRKTFTALNKFNYFKIHFINVSKFTIHFINESKLTIHFHNESKFPFSNFEMF